MTSEDDMNEMFEPAEAAMIDAVVAWHAKLQQPDCSVGDWEAFTVWLEEDPSHAAAYDEIIEADDGLADLGSLPVIPANDEETDQLSRIVRRAFLGSAMAAAAVAAFFFWPTGQAPVLETMRTAAGETRTLQLNDDIRIAMNGGTHIEYAEDQAQVRLITGEAAFFIESEEPSPLRVEVGNVTLADNGTIFNVIVDDLGTRIGVADGEVILNPELQRISIEAGQTVQIDSASGFIERSEAPVEAIAAWSGGLLVFNETPSRLVAADLGRSLGVDIIIDQSLVGSQLTGVVQLDGEDAEIVRETAVLLGGNASRSAEGWTIAAN